MFFMFSGSHDETPGMSKKVRKCKSQENEIYRVFLDVGFRVKYIILLLKASERERALFSLPGP